MSLTYKEFLTQIQNWFTSVQLSGNTVCQYSSILLEDEIELDPDSHYPACFITPQPWASKTEWMANYVCRVYLVTIIKQDSIFNPYIGRE